MFKQRLLTALILIPLVLLTLYYATAWVIYLLLSGIILLLGREWAALIPINSSKWENKVIAYLAMLLLLSGLCLYWFSVWLYVGVLIWVVLGFFVIKYPKTQKNWANRIVVATWGVILLPLFIASVIMLYRLPAGRELFIYLLFLVWAAESGAYFAGKRWGRHRLIPHVSPGKTVEGLIGGFTLSLVVCCIGYLWFLPTQKIQWFLLAMGIVLVSMLGDLFISMLKRRCQIKDTGALLPGHGGVLDRLDSLIAAVPWFYLGQYYWLHGSVVL